MIIYDPKITGSFQVNGSTVTSIGEVDSISGSVAALNAATSSYALSSSISGSFTSLSASLSTRLTDDEGSIDSLNAASSSYLLNTTDTLTGDLTVTGTITAQEFHTEYVSGSIIYTSGSTKFGDSYDDIHEFTGSVNVTNSTGGVTGSYTFTGGNFTISGDDADFNLNITSGSNIASLTEIRFQTDGGTMGRLYMHKGTKNMYLGPTFFPTSSLYLQDGTGTVMSITGSSVGIGTTTPSHPLHIGDGGGTEYIRVQGNIANSYFGSDSVGTFIGNTSDAPVYFYNSSSEKMRIDTSGNLNFSTADGVGITFKESGFITIDSDNNDSSRNFQFKDGSGDVLMTILDTGNVGIGATNPTNGRLEIQQTATTPGLWVQTGGTTDSYTVADFRTGTNLPALTIKGDGSSTFGGSIISSKTSGIFIDNVSGGTNSIQARFKNSAGDMRIGVESSTGGTMQIGTSANAAVFGNQGNYPTQFTTNGNLRMTIDSNGDIGIGTTSPVGDLHLYGGQQNMVFTNTSADGVAGLTISRIIGQARGYSNNLSVMQSIDFVTNSSTWYKGDIVFRTNNTDGTDPSVAATERIRIQADGNTKMSFNPGGGQIYWQDTTNGATMFYLQPATYTASPPYNTNVIQAANSSHIGFTTGGASRMVVDSSGFITTNPSANIQGALIAKGVEYSFKSVGSQSGYTQGAIVLSSGTDSVPGARGQGVFLFNEGNDTTWYAGSLYNSADRFDICRKSSTTSVDTSTPQSTNSLFHLNNAGSAYNATGTWGTISSDQRLKENIVNATSKLNDVMSLQVRNFNYIGKEEKFIGFIAQELEQVFPSLVTTSDMREFDRDGNVIGGLEDTKGVKVGMDFAILVKAIQEQQAIIEDLKARIETLENA